MPDTIVNTACTDERTAKEIKLCLNLATLLHDLPDKVLDRIDDKYKEYEYIRKTSCENILREIFVYGDE